MSIIFRVRQKFFVVTRVDRSRIDQKTKRPQVALVMKVPFTDPALPVDGLAKLSEQEAEEARDLWTAAKEHRRKDVIIRRVARFRTKAQEVMRELTAINHGDIDPSVLRHLAKELTALAGAALETQKRIAPDHVAPKKHF